MDEATARRTSVLLIDMKIVAKAAEDKKLGDSEEFKRRVAFARDRLLMDKPARRRQGCQDRRRHAQGL
jgi:peptidyl-prolyl cis-trans isomerase C